MNIKKWKESRINRAQVDKYLKNGRDFIDEDLICRQLDENCALDSSRVREIISKALEIETLDPAECATLLNVRDPGLWKEMEEAAGKIKKKVYDNRIVTFAPLYMSSYCVNNCLYCGFRKSNQSAQRRSLGVDEVKKETAALAGGIGHKRLIVVYGEDPAADIDYMEDTIKAVYSVKGKAGAEIRRVNVNAPPLSVEELRRLKKVGIGTFQVFQETYCRSTYNKVHPPGDIKANYRWRLYAMHRAMEAGVDDVGIGALFGLDNWKFEVMGLVYHSRELEERYGVGPHTISFPRLEPAMNSPLSENPEFRVSDSEFKKLVTVLRLAVPYTGLILTAREKASVRKEVLPLGITQTDASSVIGPGNYSNPVKKQNKKSQQFMLGDTRSLEEVVGEMAQQGIITSFCTAGYRCGRTGENIMELLKCGKEGKFCKLNAVLTFKEWVDDFAGKQTRPVAEKLIKKEIAEIKRDMPAIFPKFMKYYEKVADGQRDIYF